MLPFGSALSRRSRRHLRQSPGRDGKGEHPHRYSVHGAHLLGRCHGQLQATSPARSRPPLFPPHDHDSSRARAALEAADDTSPRLPTTLSSTGRPCSRIAMARRRVALRNLRCCGPDGPSASSVGPESVDAVFVFAAGLALCRDGPGEPSRGWQRARKVVSEARSVIAAARGTRCFGELRRRPEPEAAGRRVVPGPAQRDGSGGAGPSMPERSCVRLCWSGPIPYLGIVVPR